MNSVLGIHYGALTPEDLPEGFDVSEPLALIRIWEGLHGEPQQKISSFRGVGGFPPTQLETFSKEIQSLGGHSQALQKLSEARAWLSVFSHYDALGRELARTKYRVEAAAQ